MIISKVAFAAVLLVCVVSVAAQDKPNPMELVAVERSFAAAVAEKGIAAGFLEFLADDGILFRSAPLNGKSFMKNQSRSAALLQWEPEHAEISSAGDLGFTTGPWSLRADSSQTPSRFGQYVSIWRRQPDGTLKLVLDIGTAFPDSGRTVDDLGLAVLPARTDRPLDSVQIEIARSGLRHADSILAQSVGLMGLAEAFETVLADDAVLLREETAPAFGKEAALGILKAMKTTSSWRVSDAQVAVDGSLGYTYGVGSLIPDGAAMSAQEPFAYARIWRRAADGGWQMAVDVQVVVPEFKAD